MPSELLLAPVGAGKTEYALNQLQNVINHHPFAPVWVLSPGRRQEDALRQRLVDSTQERRIYFNITFFSFYTLYARLLDMVGKPQRELDETARLRLIQGLLIELQSQNQLTIFHKIADKSGFARIVADFIYELKQNVIFPEHFEEAAMRGTDKDRDLAIIYTSYQSMLRKNNLIDREGEGWLALEEVKQRDDIGKNVVHLLVDGFDQFNPLQAQLLALLARRAQQTVITLPQVHGREKTVGRRFTEAKHRLISAFEQAGQILVTHELPALADSRRNEGLTHLIQYSFSTSVPKLQAHESLKLIEAPDPKTEASAVMRQVKRLLLDGVSPDEILIAVRDWTLYAPHFDRAAQRYGIPTVLHDGDTLANNPAVIALLNLLELARNDFRRRDVLDVMRSPYFAVPGMGDDIINQLDVLSQEQQVIKGRQDWFDAIQASSVSITDEDGEMHPAFLTALESSRLGHTLANFFEAVSPPQTSSIHNFIEWIETLIGDDTITEPDEDAIAPEIPANSLRMIEQIRLTNETFIARDLQAIYSIKKVLRGMLTTQNLIAVLKLEPVDNISWQVFLRDFRSAVGSASFTNNTNRSGKVLITSVTDARGLPHEHVFIPGLSEGIFPRPTPEDPIYLDSEREALTQAGIFLETQSERAADDGLFYELIGLPRKCLTLSRPTIQNGAIWPESHLWRAVKAAFKDSDDIIERYKIQIGSVTKAEDVAHRSEAALAVASAFNQSTLDTQTTELYNWLVTHHRQHWQHIWHTRNIEYHRMMSHKLDNYSGRLTDPRLLDWIAAELGDKRIWSASQFNDYGVCGFHYFAKRLLKLEAVDEPEVGMDAPQRGTVVHAILEETYRELTRRRVIINSEYMETAITILHDVATRILPSAPQSFGFRPSVLWEQEQITLMRKLEALVRADFSDDSPLGKLYKGENRRPYLQEMPVSGDDSETLQLQLGGSIVNVTGYIDRIDRIGEHAFVVDYKTGSTTIPTREMTDGRNFQMMLYLLAGQAILEKRLQVDVAAPNQIIGGTFWHLNRKTSGDIHLDKPEDEEALEKAQVQLSEHIQQGRAGNFVSVPNRKDDGDCSHYCDFTKFCRVSIMNRRKQV
ncbi:MAG: hypothetical protein GC179_24330 [Anaerolineaceae bacterium]|nr:hypothetical protein [Anaerolineaceae bacterium]